MIFQCTIPGRPIVKKNTKRIFGAGRFKRIVYSPKYQEWERHAAKHVRRALNAKCIDYPVAAWFKFYFANKQGEADTSNLIEGPQDLLKKMGVIVDDKLIHLVTAQKFFGASEPRTEIELRELVINENAS